MFVRGITLSLAALLAAGMLAESAAADHRPRRIIVEDDYYPGPAFIRGVPGLRIFFGDYALTEEEFDELYGNGNRRYDRRLEEPEERVKQKRKAAKQQQEKQDKKKTAAKPAKPAGQDKSASAKQADQKKTSAASGMSCEKATSVVSGYGFSSVTPSSCSGKVYAFNATRDGKSFAIKLDSGSGELTEVKKLP